MTDIAVLDSGTTVTQNVQRKSSYDKGELVSAGRGELFETQSPRLPIPPMLMLDRITNISKTGGDFGKGYAVAELDVWEGLWFFWSHFLGDPVMPGCLGLDAIWQLFGFSLGWLGAHGRGRALEVGHVKFEDEVTPNTGTIVITSQFEKWITRRMPFIRGSGFISVDGRTIYTAHDVVVILRPWD